MKTSTLLLLLLGIVSVIANPEANNLNKNKNDSLSDSRDPLPKQNDETLNNGVIEEAVQENINTESDVNYEVTEKYGDTELDIIIEENINEAPNDIIPQVDTASVPYEELRQPQQIFDSYSYYNEILNKHPEEIMDTAEGFVPIPIFRNRQKQRRRFATRRNFRRNPYSFRRFQYYYPYPFYYPGSLRFY